MIYRRILIYIYRGGGESNETVYSSRWYPIRQVLRINPYLFLRSNGKSLCHQPWKHFQRAMSWMIGQAAWAWAKTGIWQSDYVRAYAYANDEQIHEEVRVYHEFEEKSPAEQKDEKVFQDQDIQINRTRLEVCDQEVNISFKSLYVTLLILFYAFSLFLFYLFLAHLAYSLFN